MNGPKRTGAGTHVATERGFAGAIVEKGAPVPPGVPVGRWMKPADPLDHDGDGRKGGSRAGAESTAKTGRRRRTRTAPAEPGVA